MLKKPNVFVVMQFVSGGPLVLRRETCYYGHNFINTGEVYTSVLFIVILALSNQNLKLLSNK